MKKVLPIFIVVSLAVAAIVLGFLGGFNFEPVQKKTLNLLLIICALSALYCFVAGEFLGITPKWISFGVFFQLHMFG